jgi:hypothetical protein
MDIMTLDLSQILSNMPIAGSMIWFAYHITNESRKERQEHYKAGEDERKEWSAERKEIYEKIMGNLIKQSEYIEKNTDTLKSLVGKKCELIK